MNGTIYVNNMGNCCY